MTEVQIIMPTGALGASASDKFLDTAMRVIGVGFAQPGEWASKYGTDFENDVFLMKTQYWGDCDCGYHQREEAWSVSHKHADGCYQSELRRRRIATGYWEVKAEGAFEWWKDKAPYDKREKLESAIFDELCVKFGLDRKFGVAVHCTCDHESQWKAFCETPEGQHAKTCSLEIPNFRFKPTGFQLKWYKYIGRGMEISDEPLPSDFLQQIFSTHPKGMTVEDAFKELARGEEENAKSFQAMFDSLGVAHS